MEARDDKRMLRKLKRDLKRAGSKRRRRHLKQELAEHPEDAPHSDFEFGDDSTTWLNGMDRDQKRRRREE